MSTTSATQRTRVSLVPAHARTMSQRAGAGQANISPPRDRPFFRAILKPTPRHSAPVRAKAWRTTAASYSDEELRLLLEFQRKLEDIVRAQLARLRGDLDQHAPSRG